jgi:hypothetical protein
MNSTATPVSGREFLRHRVGDEIAPAATPDADDELILRLRRHRDGKGKEREQKTLHVQLLRSHSADCARKDSVLHLSAASLSRAIAVAHSSDLIVHQPNSGRQ